MRTVPAAPALIALVLACGPREGAGEGADTTSALAASSPLCYVSARSILGRHVAPAPGLASTQQSPPDTLRGWLRLDRDASADSGAARLIDSDRASLGASWRRMERDSLVVTGFDDFLRVELRLAASGDGLRGRAVASSDASFDRQSDGSLVEYRREWTPDLAPASCDSLPGAG